MNERHRDGLMCQAETRDECGVDAHWESVSLRDFIYARIIEDERRSGGGNEPESWCDRASGSHYSAARVAAECDAKRRIVGVHSLVRYQNTQTGEADDYCEVCVKPKDPPHSYPCDTLRAVAAVYADHPDYREEWKP